MPTPNELAANLKPSLIVKQAGKLIYNQIGNSVLSKQGKTTLTGIFEGTPQNVVVNRRGFTAPGQGVSTTTTMMDQVTNTTAKTYLESLKNKRR